jgi:hypothetical protein
VKDGQKCEEESDSNWPAAVLINGIRDQCMICQKHPIYNITGTIIQFIGSLYKHIFFFGLIRYGKTINITRPSKKTLKQSISYDFVAVTLVRITF